MPKQDSAIVTSSRNGGAAVYKVISDELRGKIIGGEYTVGQRLPTEIELCKYYEASRFTIREALRELVELGLIERRQGAGSRVISSVPSKYAQTMRTLGEFFQYARNTHFEIVRVDSVRLTEREAEIVGAPAGSRWLCISGVRWAEGKTKKICHTTVYVHVRFDAFVRDAKTAPGPIYATIESRSGERIAEAIQETTATYLSDEAAAALDEAPGAYALRLTRRYFDVSGGLMLTSVNLHPAEGFSHIMRIRRGDWVP